MTTIPEALAIALQHHQTGRLSEAEQIYREILSVDPNHADTWHLLGVLADQVGRHGLAIEYIQQAIALNNKEASFYSNLGEALRVSAKPLEAIKSYRRALELRPDYAEAYNNLGLALVSQGELEEAAQCHRRALELKPDFAEAHNNLGNALQAKGKYQEAVASYRQALRLRPDLAETHRNLGIAFWRQGDLNEAIECYRRALELSPDHAQAHTNLGNALQKLGKADEAVLCFRRAARLALHDPDAQINLANALWDLGKLEDAEGCYRQAMQLRPSVADIHNNLGNLLQDLGRIDEAIANYRRALELKPDLAVAHNNLGTAFQILEKWTEAAACYQRALDLDPQYAEAHNNLGSCRQGQGDLQEAFAGYRRAVELRPDYVVANCNLMMTLLFRDATTSQECSRAHEEFNQRFGVPLTPRNPRHSNDRNPDRRLRIGYLSPDFRYHVVGYNVRPLLREHDRHEFEVFAYSLARRRDELTAYLQAHCEVWRNVAGLTAEAIAEQVGRDRIDILVDLALHTVDNRLLALAHKPAPVQATFAGYPGTTGLSAIDYRLTDPQLDPPGLFDHCYSEASYRLPHSFWCYDPPQQEPPVNPLPALTRGYVTFGCLNNFCKVNESGLRLWAQVLGQVKESRLCLQAPEGDVRQATLDRLLGLGVANERVTFVSRLPHLEYLKLYHQIDIGLDTLPYNGHTTSLDSYWMGVPVITLVGQTVVGRAGLSQLTNLKLTELIAYSPAEFVKIAVELAQDLPRLAALRATLRQRMKASPLMDAQGFAQGIEAAYRTMWRRWCAG